MNRRINGNGISNAIESMDGHCRIDKSDNWNVKFESFVDDRRFTLSVDNDDAIRWLSGTETKPLVARTKLLRAVTVGEEPTSAPKNVGRRTVTTDFFGHKFEDFIEERVGVDEHEASILTRERRNEVEGTAHAN